jgi:hypothetical protein
LRGLLRLLLDYLLLRLRLLRTSLRALFPKLWLRLRPGLALLRPASGFLLGPLNRSLLIGLTPHVLLSLSLLTGLLPPRLNLLQCGISSLLLGRDCSLTCSIFLGLPLLTCSFYLLSLGLLVPLLAHSFSLCLLRPRAIGLLLLELLVSLLLLKLLHLATSYATSATASSRLGRQRGHLPLSRLIVSDSARLARSPSRYRLTSFFRRLRTSVLTFFLELQFLISSPVGNRFSAKLPRQIFSKQWRDGCCTGNDSSVLYPLGYVLWHVYSMSRLAGP